MLLHLQAIFQGQATMTASHDDHSILFEMIYDNNHTCLDMYLRRESIDVNSTAVSRDGKSLVHVAAELDDSECLRVLLSTGANKNAAASLKHNGNTPLHIAAANKSSLCLKLLLDYGASARKKNSLGQTPFDVAVRSGSVDCITCLAQVRRAAKRRSQDIKELKESFLSAMNSADAKSLLAKFPEDPSIVKSALGDASILCKACYEGAYEAAHVLLQNGASLIQERKGGNAIQFTALHSACKAPYKESDEDVEARKALVENLLQFRPELLDVPDSSGALPLHLAAAAGHSRIVALLLRCYKAIFFFHLGLNSGGGDDAVAERFFIDVAEGYLENVGSRERLLDVNYPQATNGDTSLHVAAARGHSNVVETILDFSAQMLSPSTAKDVEDHFVVDLTLTNDAGLTALHLAVEGEFVRIVEILLERQNDECFAASESTGIRNVDCVASVKKPLVLAVEKRNLAVIKAFLRYDSCCDLTEALRLALESSSQDLAMAFLEKQIEVKMATELAGSTSGGDGKGGVVEGKINWHGLGLKRLDSRFLDCAIEAIRQARIPSCLPNQHHYIGDVDLSANKLTSVPFELFSLSQLKILNLSYNDLTVLFDGKGFLPTLHEDADIEANSLSSMLTCVQLETLRLDENRLTELPPELFNLPRLKLLFAVKNEIASLPENIWTAPALTTVNLSRNRLEALPGPYGSYDPSLTSVQSMPDVKKKFAFPYVAFRRLSTPCSSGAGEESKRRLVKSARIREIELSSSPSIQKSQSQIVFSASRRPDLLKQDSGSRTHHKVHRRTGLHGSLMAQHEYLIQELSGKSLVSGVIDDEAKPEEAKIVYRYLASSVSIDETDESENSLSAFADSRLESLNVSRNPLKGLPVNFPCLVPSLKRFQARHCQLKVLDPVLMMPQSLVSLDVSHNTIQSVLYKLDVRPCPRLTGISMNGTCRHQQHDSLPNLIELSMNDNLITSFELQQVSDGPVSPDGVDNVNDDVSDIQRVALYPQLNSLNLARNRLRFIPQGIGELQSLQTLDVSENVDILKLPCEIIHLKELWQLGLAGVTLADIGDNVKKQGAKQILNFLKHQLKGSKPYRRLKLMTVGLANKGKTTLVEQLIANEQLKWLRGKPKKSTSTVGIDISEWVCKRGLKNPIAFSIWDFAGQEEYYATHQCFLSRRSLYLVLWDLRDNVQGICELAGWLSNIQARAPGSPVIIVGTHLDLIVAKYEANADVYVNIMRQEIKSRYVRAPYSNFPEVAAIVEVALGGKIDKIEMLRSKIVDVATSMRDNSGDVGGDHSLSKKGGCTVLEEQIPKTYLNLGEFAADLKVQCSRECRPPVLTTDEFRDALEHQRPDVWSSMKNPEELSHASQFLHNNGVLLHYDDSLLRNLYFVDPQWLCKMLARVVAVEQINPFARSGKGVMKTSDLQQLFKGREFPSHLLEQYVSLLEKFEVALRQSDDVLLIPSLLPTKRCDSVWLKPTSSETAAIAGNDGDKGDDDDLVVDLESSGQFEAGSPAESIGYSEWVVKSLHTPSKEISGSTMSNVGSKASSRFSRSLNQSVKSFHVQLLRPELATQFLQTDLSRFYLAPFHPSGWWPRLISRLLADQSIHKVAQSILAKCNVRFSAEKIQWKCWRTGIDFVVNGSVLLSVCESDLSRLTKRYRSADASQIKDEISSRGFQVLAGLSIDDKDEYFSSLGCCCIEIAVSPSVLERMPAATERAAAVPRKKFKPPYRKLLSEYRSFDDDEAISATTVSSKRPVGLSILRSLSVGRPGDERKGLRKPPPAPSRAAPSRLWSQRVVEKKEKARTAQFIRLSTFLLAKVVYHVDSLLEDWYDGLKTTVVGSEDKSLVTRVVPCPHCLREFSSRNDGQQNGSIDEKEKAILCDQVTLFSLLSCLSRVYGDGREPRCLRHGSVSVDLLAPDVVFRDLPFHMILNDTAIMRGTELGHGGYGTVYSGRLASNGLQGIGEPEVAVKSFERVLQSHPEVEGKEESALLYKTVRNEVALMANLDHPNVVALLGICIKPICMVIPRAPYGDLERVIEIYQSFKAQIRARPLQAALLEIARGMHYIHDQNIVYRDLKPSNVLVWAFPLPDSSTCSSVKLKISDYGVSSFTANFGVKKETGTRRYLAPEILRFAGKEAYTKKVDVFAYGLVMYYMLTLLKPFHSVNHLSIGSKYLNRERPVIPSKDFRNFFLVHLLMEWCWADDALARPDFGTVVDVLENSLFLKLIRRTLLTKNIGVTSACVVDSRCHGDVDSQRNRAYEVWMGTSSGQLISAKYTDRNTEVDVLAEFPSRVMSISQVGNTVWIGTEYSGIVVYSVLDRSELQSWPIFDDLFVSRPPPSSSNCALSKPSSRRLTISSAITSIFHEPGKKIVIVTKSDGYVALFEDVVSHLHAFGDSFESVSPNSQIPIRLRLRQDHRLPNKSTAYCAVSVPIDDASGDVEVWLGLDSCRLAVLDSKALEYGNVKFCRVLCGPIVERPAPRVKCLVSSSNHLGTFVWNSLDGSAVIVQWNGKSRDMISALNIENCLNGTAEKRDSRVTCLCIQDQYLLAGTGSGHVVGLTWNPVLRASWCVKPHAGPVRCLLSFISTPGAETSTDDGCSIPALFSDSVVTGRRSVVLSCGLGLLGVGSDEVASSRPFPGDTEGYMVAWLTYNSDAESF